MNFFYWNKAFAKKLADDRKKWLSDWMETRRRRLEEGRPEVYMYGMYTSYFFNTSWYVFCRIISMRRTRVSWLFTILLIRNLFSSATRTTNAQFPVLSMVTASFFSLDAYIWSLNAFCIYCMYAHCMYERILYVFERILFISKLTGLIEFFWDSNDNIGEEIFLNLFSLLRNIYSQRNLIVPLLLKFTWIILLKYTLLVSRTKFWL